MTDKPTVLFVCLHNANRSQVAAGYLRELAGDRVEVLSAGPRPADRLNPAAVEVMAEEGIDIAAARPQPLTDDALQAADVVVTLGCADACTAPPGTRHEDWSLGPGGGEGLQGARATRDEIKHRVQALAADLLGPEPAAPPRSG